MNEIIKRLRKQAKSSQQSLGKIVNISVNYSYDYLERVHTDPAARWLNKLPGGSFFDPLFHQ